MNPPQVTIENFEKALRKSISLNPQSDFTYVNLGHLYLMQERHDEALVAGKKSVALNPKGDYNMVLLAMTLIYCGRNEEAIPLYKDAWRQNPYCSAWYIHAAGVADRNLEKWDEAIATAKKALDRKPYGIVSAKWGFQSALQNERVFQPIQIPLNLQSSWRQVQVTIPYHTNCTTCGTCYFGARV